VNPTLAQLAPATPVAEAVQVALGALGAAPAVVSSTASAVSEAAITPASGDALEKDTPDAARGCTPLRPRDLLVQCDMFGGATVAPEADHTVTTKARKPRARKASRPVAVAPCDHFLKVRIPGELHEQLMAKAGARGQRLGTLVRDLLQAQTQTDDLAGAVIQDSAERHQRIAQIYASLDEEARAQTLIVAGIVCESLIDAMTFWCAGLRNVTAAYGVEGVTDDLLALLAAPVDGRARRVLIAFDRDDAGERGATKLAETLMARGVDCWRVQFPRGMDANEYALKVQPAAKSLALLVRKALWLGKGEAPARAMEPVSTSVEATAAKEEPPSSLASEAGDALERFLALDAEDDDADPAVR
jgi:hypothetical protein